MRDPRPLSQRFDLSYVHRRTPLQTWIMRASLGLALVCGLFVLVFTNWDWQDIAQLRQMGKGQRSNYSLKMYFELRDQDRNNEFRRRQKMEMFSPGALSSVHAGLACRECHKPDLERSTYWLSVRDSACLYCHRAPAHEPHGSLFGGKSADAYHDDSIGRVPSSLRMSGQCRVCHVEHHGAEHDLKRLSDATCVQCHGDLPRYLSQHTSTPGARATGESRDTNHAIDRLKTLAQNGGGN